MLSPVKKLLEEGSNFFVWLLMTLGFSLTISFGFSSFLFSFNSNCCDKARAKEKS
jgi:hypothetical protein